MDIWKEELYHYGVKGMKWRNRKMTDAEYNARTAEANYRRAQPLVKEVMKGNYGNEAERQRRLGASYYNVQKHLNKKILGRDTTPGNYAKNDRYSHAEWSKTLQEQAAARRTRDANQRMSDAKKRRRATENGSAGNSSSKTETKRSSYQRGYDFASRLLTRKKKKR